MRNKERERERERERDFKVTFRQVSSAFTAERVASEDSSESTWTAPCSSVEASSASSNASLRSVDSV